MPLLVVIPGREMIDKKLFIVTMNCFKILKGYPPKGIFNMRFIYCKMPNIGMYR
jgi:hypothetical protein